MQWMRFQSTPDLINRENKEFAAQLRRDDGFNPLPI